MSKRLFGIILAFLGILAFHLMGSQVITAPTWTTQIPNKIYTSPEVCNGHALFIGGDKGKHIYNLYQIAPKGNLTKSIDLPHFVFQPIVFKDSVVIADKARMIRGFSVPGLQLKWESATIKPLHQAPIKINSDNFIVTSDSNLIFCLNRETGKPVWQKQVLGTIASLGYGKVITCIYGYTDTKNVSWKLEALDPEDGETLWTLGESVGPEKPEFIQGLCILTDKSGKVIIIDQNSGNIVFRGTTDDIKIVKILDDKLIMLASGGTRLICMSLMTGNSWTTTLQSGFVNVSSYNNRLMIVDKKALRCVDDDSGTLLWKRDLNDVYNAYSFYNGIFVTHKESFFARATYGSYIDAMTGQTKWAASGRGLFYKPVVFGNGYLLLSYPGKIRLMPRSQYNSQTPTATSQTKGNNPIKVNFFNGKKGNATKHTASEPVQAPKEDIDDTGWVN